MQKPARVPLLLRWSALLLMLAGVGLWAGAGARLGWTQTSVVTLLRDEVTGIDYPVRQPAFVAGVDVPLAAATAAVALAALSFAWRRAPRQA